MDGAAVAFVLIIATLCERFIVRESAVLDGEIPVAPDGAAARRGDVASEVAIADGSCAVIDHTTSASDVPAAADGAVREGEVAVLGDDDDAALVVNAAKKTVQRMTGQVDGHISGDGERTIVLPGDVIGENDVVPVTIGCIKLCIVTDDDCFGHLDRDGVVFSPRESGTGFMISICRCRIS